MTDHAAARRSVNRTAGRRINKGRPNHHALGDCFVTELAASKAGQLPGLCQERVIRFYEILGECDGRVPRRTSGITQMLLRLFFSTALVLFALVTMPPSHAAAQASVGDQPGMIPAPADEQLDPRLQRQIVFFRSNEQPGTIIVHTSERFLYVVQPGGRALRYGIGVGRQGFQWQGLLKISRKEEWPDWTPPDEMIQRQPYLPRWVAGGPGNPLGARALYLAN